MLAADMRPYAMTLPALKAYLPNLQKSMALEHKVPNKTKTNAEKSHSAENPKKGNGKKKVSFKAGQERKTTNGSFCSYCRDLENGNENTHAKADCHLLKSAKRGCDSGPSKTSKFLGKKKSFNHNRNAEMNVVAKAAVKEYVRSK